MPNLWQGSSHPKCVLKSNPSGFLVKFKLVPKENKDEETGEEKGEEKEEKIEEEVE